MQVQLLVWIFVMRIMMLVSSAVAYFLNEAIAKASYGNADEMNFEAPLTSLVWLTSIVSIVLTFIVSQADHSGPGRRHHAVVEAGFHHFLRHAGGRGHSGTGQGFHLDRIPAREGSRDLGARKAAHRSTFSRALWLAISPATGWTLDGRS